MFRFIHEEKSIAYIIKKGEKNYELLVYAIHGSKYRYFRLPGGGKNDDESSINALYREVKEETGLGREDLVYLRKAGRLEYYKPGIAKQVSRTDYLLHVRDGVVPIGEKQVTGNDKDKGCTFAYEWIDNSRFAEIDPELRQFLNPYNVPELFLDSSSYGLAKGSIVLRKAHDQWKRMYEFEAIELSEATGGLHAIDHIGSTAVAELHAKPIIDILVGLKAGVSTDMFIHQLESIGYTSKGSYGIEGRLYFMKGTNSNVLFHVHAFSPDDPKYQAHLNFAEKLNGSKELRNLYEQYKFDNAGKTREAYTEGKQAIVEVILGNKADKA